jgi:hypothetical protein
MKDLSILERELPAEIIAIQENQDRWERRQTLLAIAKEVNGGGGKLVHLEFPHTEIQVFGSTAIMYYTYVFETEFQGNRYLSKGRGTEIFILRDGKWTDVGWHLDNGPAPSKSSKAP